MKNKEYYKYYVVFALYFIGFGIVVAALTSYVNYKITFRNIDSQIGNNAKSIFQEKSFLLNQIVKRYTLMVQSYSKNELLLDYIENPVKHNKVHLDAFFFASVDSTLNVMQLRYIDETGMERVRVDRTAGGVVVIPDAKLQNKADRYYYKETAVMPEGTIWKSAVDLNVEHGVIEQPLNATFRMSSPVYSKGKFRGIIIVNLAMNSILQSLINSPDFDMFLCDKEGQILVSSEHTNDWGRYLENRKTLAEIMPENADNILSKDTFESSGLFSFNMEPFIGNGESLRLVFNIKKAFMINVREENTYAAFLVAATVLLVSICLSWIAAYIPSKLQSKLTRSNRELQKFTDILDEYVITASTDKEQVITRVSKAFCDISGYDRNELIGKTNRLIRHPDNDMAVYKDLWDTIIAGDVWKGELRCINKQGCTFWLKKIISADKDENGDILGYTSVDYDFTAIKAVEEMSVTDQLTKISNRRRLDEALEVEMHRFNRYRHDFCAILLDIDHFKNVNDTYGHLEGDNVLVGLAKILKENCRTTDIVGRWGGEEFLIIVPDTDAEHCRLLAEKIRLAVAEHNFGAVGHVTASFGVAQYQYGETIAHFIVRADDALYKAKQSGRNRTEIAEIQI